MSPGKPGTPRYQRFLNRCFLLDLEEELTGSRSEGEDTGDADLTATDVFRLNAKDTIVESESGFFNDVINDEEARERWAPFLNISLDEQEALLSLIGASSVPRETALSEEALLLRGHHVNPKYAEALRGCSRNAGYFDFLCRLEVLLTHYLLLVGNCPYPRTAAELAKLAEAKFVEDGQHASPFMERLIGDGSNRFPYLQVTLPSSYHRLLCHALCSYYRVESGSIGEEAVRVTQIRIGKAVDKLAPDWSPSLPTRALAAQVAH